MATWEQIIEDPAFGDLPTSAQADIRRDWYDLNVLPGLRETGIDEANLGLIRQKDITEYDNGQGYISSFASAAGRGAASTFTSAVQGVGALTGSESIEQAARDMSTAVTENLTVNPTMEKTNFAGNVLGNVAGFLVPGTLGMRVGKAAGMGAQLGGQIASNATILASGAGSGAQTADQYGVQGENRTGMVLGNMATELLSERIPFGLGSELKAMGRLAGLGEDAAKRTGGFFSDVGQNAVEEMAANTGSNLVTSAFVPEGVQTPGIFEGNLEAAAGGAIGGAFFGGINLMAPAAPKPSEVIVEGATQRAMAGNDAEAAAEIPGAKLQPTAAPQVPGAAAFDPTLSEQLAPAAGELPPPAGFAETTPAEAFPANLPEGLPAAAAVPGAVPEAFPTATAVPEQAPAEEVPLELYNAPQETAPTLAPIEADAASSEEMSVYFNDLKSALASSEDEDIMRGLREAATEMKQSGATWETTGIQERMALGAVYAEAVNRNLEIPRSEALEFYSGVGAASQAQPPGNIPFAAQTPPVPAAPGQLPMEGAMPAAPDMMQPAPPATAVPPITPAVASQGATPSDLIDQTGRLTVEGAQSMIEAIQSLGLTTAPFVINSTGVAPGVTAPPAAGSTRPVDGTPTIFLNRERMTLDTPLHETTHLLTPTLLAEQPDLYAAGAALLADSPLRQAIVNRYVTEAGMTMTDEQITEEAMVTGLANNGAEWLRAYAGNAKMTRAIKEFLAKVREWFDDLMYSKGFDPNMSLEQFYKKVNRQMLAGKLQQRAANAPVQAMSLAGPRAEMSEPQKNFLKTAEAMTAAGKTSEEVRAVTGWFPGKYDGKMRFEVPDDEVKSLTPPSERSRYRLAEIMDHKALFKVYPELKDLQVRTDPSMKTNEASFSFDTFGRDSYVTLRSVMDGVDRTSVLLHEIQHWIQNYEGFALGSSPGERQNLLRARKRYEVSSSYPSDLKEVSDAIKAATKKLEAAIAEKVTVDKLTEKYRRTDELRKEVSALKDRKASIESGLVPWEFANAEYRSAAGEIESRDVQARQGFTPTQRREIPPYSSEDIDPADASVNVGLAPNTRFSLAPATPQDKAYVVAVESGDVAAQQKLVNDAAEAAGVPSIGVNINDSDRDYTGMIFRGEKTVETRDSENNALKKYVGKRVAIVRTGIKKAKAMVMGYVTVGEPVRYYSEEEFAADFTRHRVTGGKFAFSGFKIGYPMEDVTPIEPYEAPEAPGQTVIMTRPIHEPVAYDENDKIILPSQRFDNFTRYSLAPAEQKVDAESIKAEFSPKTEAEQTAYDKASSNTVTARNPYLAVAAVRMRDKKITVDRYAELVENLDPFTVKGPEKIPTEAKILQYISSEKAEKVMQPIPEGKLTEFRIDIPTYNSSTAKGDTVYAITGHEPVGDTATRVGKPISYLGAAKVTNATFSTRSISGKGSAVDIAAGGGKFPLATVKGNYESITSLPKDINDPKVWTEVGYNPIRSSGFVDVRSNKYVVGGSEAIMVGPRVFVKNAVFESKPTGIIGADTKFSLAPAVTKPSNVARNQAGTRVRVLMENQTYEGQTMDDARDQALSLYDENVDKGFTVAQHMAFIQDLRTNAGRKYQDMTFGAYAGMYVRDLMDESTNPETDPMSQAFAKREVDRVAAMMAEEAAIGGRQAKAFDLYDRIANSPEMTVRQHEQLLPFDGKQNVKNDFDKAATTAREEMEGLANEAINTAPEDSMTSAINQQVAAVAKGEETSNVGEVVLDEVKPAETLEDLPEWFRKGQDALGEKLSAIIDEITTRIALSAYLNRKDGTYSLSAEERSANLAKLIKQIEDSGQTVEQAKAENNKRITELTRELNKTQAKGKPKAAPVPKEAPPEGEIQDIVAARINRLLDKIVKPSTSPAKTRTDKEVLVDAIVSTMMAKAGLPADLKAGGDNVTLAFGLVVANPQLAAQSVQAVYDLLQSDPASANITSSDKIRGFMQMLTGQSFADGKAYGEKQLNTVLKNELKRLKISVNDVAMDAALTGKTVEQLEAALRDPSRELSKVLSADALNKVVAAVTGEFRKTAAERADGIRSQQAQARVLQDMIDEKNMVIADFKAARAKKKKAAEDAKKETKKYEDLWTRLKNGEDKAAIRQAERQVRAAQAAEMKAEADWAAHQSAESEAISEEAQRSSRDLMEQQNKLNTTDRKFRLALNRKARKAMRRKLAKRGGFMIPLDQTEAEELLDQKPKTVLQYLAREYGFSLTDIIGMARDQDRQATLEAKVGKLAQALGLTKEQADKFMGPVIAEGMKHISEARKKDVSQRINRVLTPVIGKKKTQKTEAEKLIKLAEMGGLTADNVEKLLLNSKDAKEFTPEFRQELIDLIAQANDPHLTQISRDLLTGKFLDKIKAARGITVLGLLGEWTMSNIFMSILSTFKVNFVWGFIKAASDSGIFITISGPAAARADAIAKGVTPAPRLAVSKVLFRQWLRGYAVNMQHNAAFMWSEGRGKDESDFTSQFANTGMELLSRIKDAQIQWSNDGKVLPQSAQKVIKAMAAFGKYTRRTMVASDFINRTSAFEMSKVLEAVKVMQAKGGAASTATIQREIDDALYGGSFKDAFAKANKQADDEIAAKKLNKPERGIRVGEIMDEMLGKNLGMTEKQTQEYLQDSRENAKRWSLANQTEGIFGEISNLMLAATRKFPGLKFSLPAVRMPIAAFSQTLDWTPYGFLRLYAIDKNSNETESFTNYLFNSKNEYGNWNKPVGGVPAYRKTDLMAKASIGSLIMIGLCIKAFLSFDEDEDEADFYITGLGPSDPAENKAWREKGNAPFTFRFNGGTGFRFQESPFYGMLAPIAAWSDAHRYGKPGEAESDRIAYAMGKTLAGFQEAVVMKNLSDILAGGSSYSADGQLRNWSKATSRLASNVLMPRLGGEINTILYGPQDQKALGWGGRALANVPFVPSFNNKPAQDFLGREIHTKREGMLGEIYPALAHRVLAPSLDDPILNFVAKMSPNFLATTRRFKDGTRVMDNYEFVRKWNAAAGVKIREYLTPERMASFERKLAKDKPDAQTEFNVEINKIRTAALRKFSEVQF